MTARPPGTREIFIAAVKLPPDAWDAYLAEACGGDGDLRRRVRELLDAHRQASSFLDGSAPDIADSPGEPSVMEGPGTIIGPYRLVEEIGEGGMGLVFVAEQEHPVRRRVALKVVKPGMDTRQVIARFEAERQALALMDHPNVARVLDAGATESGRPYFVMELIQGVPITAYCDRCEMATRDRLGLFVQACRGIQHAHQKGVIHRDVKPTNVLVAIEDGRPVAKVIDFGVAKAINQRLTDRTIMTGFAQMLGTPLYMSPEQAEMSPLALDTRTDIYSLGVLLYEILTGTTPFEGSQLGEASFDEVRRVIRDVEPPAPSTRISTLGDRARAIAERRRTDPRRLRHEVRGDLDWIAMKTLEKDRARRYETAIALATDVERYLRHEPVEACPPSRIYRLRKLVRRNRSSIIAAACLVGAFLVLAGSIGWIASDRASRRVVLEREVLGAIEEAGSSYRSDRTADALASVKRAEGLLADGGGSAELAQRVKRWRSDLDTVVRLDAIRAKQVRERDVNLDWKDADVAYRAVFVDYGIDPEGLDAGEAAERLRASAIRDDLLAGLDSWVLARSYSNLQARTLIDVARLADADPWRNRLRDALLKEEKEVLFELARDSSFNSQPPASILLLARALRRLEEATALETLRRAQQEHPADFWINLSLGYSLEVSDPPEAIPFYRAALALRPASFGAHLGLGNALLSKGDLENAIVVYRRGIALHPAEGRLRVNLGIALGRSGRDSEEEEEVRRALELQPNLMEAHYNLAQILFKKKGKRDEAIPLYRRVIELKPAPHQAARAHEQLGVLFREEGNLDEAIAEWRKAIAIQPDLGSAYQGIIEALYTKGDLDGALAESQEAVEVVPQNAEVHYSLGVALGMKDRPDDAAAAYRKAIELDPRHAGAIMNLAVLSHKQGKTDDAIVALRKSAELKPAFLTYFNLGSMLAEQGQFDEARAAYRKALELDPASLDIRRWLGTVLVRQGKLDEAVAELREAIKLKPDHADFHGALGDALRESGQLSEALLSYKRYQELGDQSTSWKDSSAAIVADCEKLIELEGRLPRVLAGEEALAGGKERLAFADLGYRTRRFELAARFYEEALAADPGLATQPPGVHRYNAACSAALAGAGEGRDASPLDGAARAGRRAQALAWLRAELAEAASRWEKDPAARPGVGNALHHWLHDPDLRGLRGDAGAAGLLPEERSAADDLWRGVRELLRRAEEEGKKLERS